MRIKCEFKADRIPMAYQMMMVSLIKEALKKVNLQYYEKIYIYDEEKKNKKSKDFTFGVYVKDYLVDGQDFIVKDRVIVTFTSPDYEFMVNLHNGIMEKKSFQYKGYNIQNIKISMLPEGKVDNDEVIFSTLSPIAIRSRDGKFIDIDDEEYGKELNYISNVLLNSYRGYGLKRELSFESISMKKVVVKAEIKGFAEKSNGKYLLINSYKGLFKLFGDKEDLNLLYQLGLGYRRNEGFGMVDIVG